MNCNFSSHRKHAVSLKHIFDKSRSFSKLWIFKSLKKTNFAHFVSRPFGGKLTKPIFWQMWRLVKALKFQKLANPNFADIVTFSLLWWKTNERHLLTKLRTFHCFETSKDCKGKLCSFYKLSVWWKTTQILLLTKVVASTSRHFTK